MKRNWDVIREVLIEVEALDQSKHQNIEYRLAGDEGSAEKAAHGLLLWRAGFVSGVDASTLSGRAVIADGLTWQGHELLDAMRSKTLWDRIKTTASEKGLELSFDAVKTLSKVALESMLRG